MRLCACSAVLRASLICAVGILASSVLARTSGFDPRDVIRQVRSGPSAVSREPSADNGEFLIDTSTTYVPARGGQNDAVIAFDGTNFLVVWADPRSGSGYADIYGARVTPQGVVLDPSGIAISEAAGSQRSPALAYDGANFLVVWDDGRTGRGPDIYGARVTPSGLVLDPSGIAVSTAEEGQESPAVAFDGANFLVVWADNRSGPRGHDIYGARVTGAGVVLDPAGIAVSTAAHGQLSTAVAFNGTNYLVVWADERSGPCDIYGARLTPEGAVLDLDGIPIAAAVNVQWSPAVVSDGANYFVVWNDYRSGLSDDIYGARVTGAGAVLDSAGIVVSIAAHDQSCSAAAFDGTSFLVVWEDQRGGSFEGDIYGARVTPQGAVLDPAGIAVSAAADDQGLPNVSSGGGSFFVVWTDSRGSTDIRGARVTPAGTVLDPSGITVSTAADEQGSPAAACDGENFLVVWTDSRSGECDIYGARVTPQGMVLDPSGFVISQAAGNQYSPVLAYDGASFLVVWEDYRSGPSCDIYGVRVTGAGVVLDPAGIAVSTAVHAQKSPAVGSDGSNFLVVWSNERSGPDYDIYGTRVTRAGVVLDPSGISVCAVEGCQLSPAVAFDGSNSLVVWEDYRSGSSYDIYGVRVTPQGTVLDPSGIVISRAAGGQYSPALAFDGANCLVVWNDYRSGSSCDIYGTRVTPQGAVLDPAGIAVSLAAGYQSSPAAAFDGANHLVVWQDERGGTWDTYGARVNPGGIVLGEFPVIMQEGNQLHPALARGAGSQMFLVYQGWAGTVGGKTYNTDRIWGWLGPFPGIQETPNVEVRTPSFGPTVIRGVLVWSATTPSLRNVGDIALHNGAELLDIAGRRLLDLVPGPNDVSRVPPGVYFVRSKPSAVSREPSAVWKVIVTR